MQWPFKFDHCACPLGEGTLRGLFLHLSLNNAPTLATGALTDPP